MATKTRGTRTSKEKVGARGLPGALAPQATEKGTKWELDVRRSAARVIPRPLHPSFTPHLTLHPRWGRTRTRRS